jgi:outer membrane protein assembly factor BamB
MTSEHRKLIPCARKGVLHLVPALLLAAACNFTGGIAAFAGDWPGFLGKNRDGVAQDEKPLAPWKATLEPAWKISLGAGFAGPAVAQNKLFIPHREGKSDHLDCYPISGEKRLWRATFPATYAGGYDPDKGPRAVPLVNGDQVFFYTATADLHCVSTKDGAVIWSRKFSKDYDLKESYFGVGATPLLLEKSIIVALGGKNGAAVVALDRASGKTLWQSAEDDVSYSSPILATRKGAPIIIAALREKCVGLAPADGKVLFDIPFGDRGLSVTAATPLVEKEKLFLTAEYQIGAAMLDLSKDEPVAIWENDDSLSCHYNTPIFFNGHLYGARGREDYRQGDLRCVDAATGKVLWEEPKFGVASAIRVEDQILFIGVDGQLRLIKASPKKYEQLAEAALGSGKFRAAPAYSNGKLYVRASLTPTTSELRVFELTK